MNINLWQGVQSDKYCMKLYQIHAGRAQIYDFEPKGSFSPLLSLLWPCVTMDGDVPTGHLTEGTAHPLLTVPLLIMLIAH